LGAALLLAAHRARESDDRTVLSAPPSPCTSCVIGRYEQSVRSTVVEAADQAATSSLGKKAQAAAAAKPSMRSPRVTRSTASTDPDGACFKPAV